ncbi:MAG: ATPase domain-containing protein [Nitrososphaerales archaeon]
MPRNLRIKTNSSPLLKRCSTGIANLDDALSGGFPEHSMILVGGGPGSGKTILGMTFLVNGADKFGEKGLYISFSESKQTMYAELKSLGIDLQKLENAKKFWFEEMMSVSGASMGDALGQVVTTISKNGIKRVVLDSITAIGQSFEHEYQTRQILHTVVSKLVRNLGCTTLVISERLSQSLSDSHFEEFVADGVIGLKHGPPRELEIRKMRGTELSHRKFICTMHGGFDVLKTEIKHPTKPKIWKLIPNPEGMISTGSEDFDRALKGGFPVGSYVIFEADTHVTVPETRLITAPLVLNQQAQGHAVLAFLSTGVSSKGFVEQARRYLPPDGLKYSRLAHVAVTDEERKEFATILPYMTFLKGGKENLDVDTNILFKTLSDLKLLTGSKPALRVIYYDALEGEASNVHNEIVLAMNRTQLFGDFTVGIARPSLSILPKLLDMVDWHFRLSKSHGTLTLQGIKPQTPLYAIQCDITEGFQKTKLIEVN